MDHFYVSLLLLFVSLVYLSIFFLFYKHKSHFTGPNLPPGHIGYPMVGESLEFLSDGWKGHPEKFIFNRLVQYSCEVFKTSLFSQPAAVVCGPACNEFLFSNKNKLVTAWWPDSVNKIFPSSLQTNSREDEKVASKFPEARSFAKVHWRDGLGKPPGSYCIPASKRYTFWLACRLFLSVEDPTHIALRFVDPFQLLSAGSCRSLLTCRERRSTAQLRPQTSQPYASDMRRKWTVHDRTRYCRYNSSNYMCLFYFLV